MTEREELISVALYREDLRQVLVAADSWLKHWRLEGADGARLEQAIDRIAATAPGHEWQPKRQLDPPA